MKQVLPYVVALCCAAPAVFAQELPKTKLSPLTRIYLQKLARQADQKKPVEGYIYRSANHQTYVSAMIKVTPAADETGMRTLGAVIGTKAGNIWTVQIPVNQVQAFARLSGISYLQLDEPTEQNLDRTLIQTRTDSVHAGINLPMPYTGKDVVVGVIDIGFDYTSPGFFGTNGTGYRVKRVWEQKRLGGTPPAGFSFGHELTDSVDMWVQGTDNPADMHGTFVAGIATGSGFGSSATHNRYRGVAYDADVVLVGITLDKSQYLSTSFSDKLDAMSYIFNYAASVGKPAVVNLSYASGGMGPRDGKGLFSQACDNLTGPGKLFVCAAGNGGGSNQHHEKTFTPADTLLNTFLQFNTLLPEKKQWVDLWGDSSQSFCVQVGLYNGATEVTNTGFVCLDDSLHTFTLIGSNNDTCLVSISTSAEEYNGRPRIFMEFHSQVPDGVNIRVKGNDGHVDVWCGYVKGVTGYYGSFTNGAKPWATVGNSNQTISDIAASRSAIAVGAYMSRKSFVNVSGQSMSYAGTEFDRASFSAKGPTTDNRSKPDITAPGLGIGSTVSSYHPEYLPGGSAYDGVTNVYQHPINGRAYPFAIGGGTSYASPVVAGIVALLLQADSSLTPAAIISILQQTAIKDNFTTATPNPNLWGAGKVNAYQAILRVLNPTGLPELSASLPFVLFPNPNNGLFHIGMESLRQESLQVEVLDVLGRNVFTEAWPVTQGYNSRQFSTAALAKGVYSARIISSSGSQSVSKLVVE